MGSEKRYNNGSGRFHKKFWWKNIGVRGLTPHLYVILNLMHPDGRPLVGRFFILKALCVGNG